MNADAIDAGRLTLALNELRLPTIKTIWPDFAARADKEGWPAARFLASLAEHEMAERANRRIRRNVEEAGLPAGKTLDSFDFDAVPMVSKAQIMALAAGDSWLDQGANLMFFGPPGGGKSQVSIAMPGLMPRGSQRRSELRRGDRGSDPVPGMPGTGSMVPTRTRPVRVRRP
ncbi:ATP-binding protein [Acidisoma sp. S159]|uniref:ATP-binding protein n=1 Tax=Acidisoma sp. S159 TaxID=1747225 RepID=UPI001C20C435|nr:ATP-binding protein [Acidisoma sp. S159]